MPEFKTAVITMNPDDSYDRALLELVRHGQSFDFSLTAWECTSARRLRSGKVLLTCKRYVRPTPQSEVKV